MKQTTPVPQKSSSTSITLLVISSLLLLLSVTSLITFITTDHSVVTMMGKVVDTYSKRSFSSSKRSSMQEYLVVSYTVQGKEYVKKTSIPEKYGSSHSIVGVFYYPSFPGFAWFAHRPNPGIPASTIFISIFFLITSLTVYYIVTKNRSVRADQKKGKQKSVKK
jgi:hypothetical protein